MRLQHAEAGATARRSSAAIAAPDRNTELLDPQTDAARIRAIFVHPHYARQGLGSQILAHCEAAAQEAGFRSFQMGATLTGVPLYTLKGYLPTGRVEVPLPNGESLSVITNVKVHCSIATNLYSYPSKL